MKSKIIAAALVITAFGFGCQRTYERRHDTSDQSGFGQDTAAQVETEGEPAYGVAGQQSDINTTQDLAATDETSEAFGGSGSAGMSDDWGYGGGGDAGTTMHHAADAGMMMHRGAMDAGVTGAKKTKK